MSDREVADRICRSVEAALDARFGARFGARSGARSGAAGADSADGAAKLDAAAPALPEEVVLKARYLFAARDRLAAEPDFRLPDSAILDRFAADVIGHLEALPPGGDAPEGIRALPQGGDAAPGGFRELPRLRADPPPTPPPPATPGAAPPFFAARGAQAWWLAAAVLAAMAVSVWL